MLNIGEKAPDFQLPDQTGTPISLDQLLVSGRLILYFYPADFTPICTQEACGFQERYDALQNIAIQIAGVSPQNAESHGRFSNTFSLGFPLLCDEQRQVIRLYGVEGPLGFGVRRATFLIDASKRIVNRVVADFFVSSHLKFIQSVIGK